MSELATPPFFFWFIKGVTCHCYSLHPDPSLRDIAIVAFIVLRGLSCALIALIRLKKLSNLKVRRSVLPVIHCSFIESLDSDGGPLSCPLELGSSPEPGTGSRAELGDIELHRWGMNISYSLLLIPGTEKKLFLEN